SDLPELTEIPNEPSFSGLPGPTAEPDIPQFSDIPMPSASDIPGATDIPDFTVTFALPDQSDLPGTTDLAGFNDLPGPPGLSSEVEASSGGVPVPRDIPQVPALAPVPEVAGASESTLFGASETGNKADIPDETSVVE